MVYTYTPTYYSSLHDSITTLCKNILPFSKKKRLTASEHKLSKLQSDNLKWQQDSFHQILNLMGLEKEGIVSESEVSAFRSHLIDTLIVSPLDQEHPSILRDKLLFLQELFYAKCISEYDYHSSKRPLLQRLAVQGAEIEAKDIIVAKQKENSEEEWSVIDLRDEKSLSIEGQNSKNKSKHNSAMKQIKGAASVLGFKNGKIKENSNMPSSVPPPIKTDFNPFWASHSKESETKSILMTESSSRIKSAKENGSIEKVKKKPFRTLFQREQREGHGGDHVGADSEEREARSGKKQWGFDGFKKWKRSNSEDETAPLPVFEKSDSEAFSDSCKLVFSPVGEGPDTKQIKRKLHPDGSSSDFFIDKVLGDRIKKELSRIQSELSTTNSSLQFSNDQMEAISTKLPVDKADLKKFFPKTWCDRYGDVVLDVVKKEFKDHVGEMENMRNAAREKHNSKRWTTFDDEENCHPNLFSPKEDYSLPFKQQKGFETNPFLQEDYTGKKLRHESAFLQDQNTSPFWTTSN